jgi:hypothetical protein
MVKFCSKCGAQAVEDSSLYCYICGTQLPANIIKNPDNNTQNNDVIAQLPAGKDGSPWIEEKNEAQPLSPARTMKARKSGINTGFIIIVGAVLLSLILLGFLFPPKDNFFGIISPLKDNSSTSLSFNLSGTGPKATPTPKASLTQKPTSTSKAATPTPKPTPISKTTPTTQSTLSQTPVPIGTLGLEILKLPIGEGASDGIKSVIVYSAKKTDRYSYSEANKTKSETSPKGKKFVIVNAGIKNIGAPFITVNPASFSITDSNHYKYDPYSVYNGTDGLKMQQLYLDQVSVGKILFAVPEGSIELRLQYDFGDLVSGPKLAEWPVN